MRFAAGIVTAFLLAVPAVANVAPPPLESADRAGEAAFAFMENFNAGNIDGIASTYTDAGDFLWIENGTVTFKGKADAVEGMKQRLSASPGGRLEVVNGWTITPAGEGGSLITAEFTLYRKAPETDEETAVVSGVMTLMLRLEGGEWRIVNGHTSSAISMK
jgi:ketosteroid isomerase-like protein